ncbi:hypothetical protein [Pseudomonas akapageensis]|uniref:hypothetical protein n=1 Tax=Pseudomonas akapageensis TaxID=2609961 RepID=UPI001408BD46|nr:hypothetical protein [Pseudomonas akapageensis]
MSRIVVKSGDFQAGDAKFEGGIFTLKSTLQPSRERKIPISRIAELEAADEQIVNNSHSAVRWGLAGALLLGPVGLVAGLMLCSKEKEVTFYAKFKDGRSLIATTDSATYSRISVKSHQ